MSLTERARDYDDHYEPDPRRNHCLNGKCGADDCETCSPGCTSRRELEQEEDSQ